MIILDSCTVRGIGLSSNAADVLRAIREVKAERIAVPWMAIEELAAQKALSYKERHATAEKGLAELREVSHCDEATLDKSDLDAVRKHWRKKFGELVEVLPTSEVVMAQALFREANALPPCKQTGSPNNKKKSGARDAAIWLTAVAYAHDHPNETVFFVSDNTKDFGDGSSHAFPMKGDIAGLGERFVHLTSLGQLLDRFAQPAKVDRAQVSNRLANLLPSDAIWSSFSMIARGSGEDGGTTL